MTWNRHKLVYSLQLIFNRFQVIYFNDMSGYERSTEKHGWLSSISCLRDYGMWSAAMFSFSLGLETKYENYFSRNMWLLSI